MVASAHEARTPCAQFPTCFIQPSKHSWLKKIWLMAAVNGLKTPQWRQSTPPLRFSFTHPLCGERQHSPDAARDEWWP